MNFLLIHNIYSVRGGEESVVEFQKLLLESHGHSVYLYTRKHSEMKKWLLRSVGGFFTSFYNPKTIRDAKQIHRCFRPDIVIVHNVFPVISPAIISYFAKRKVPVLMAVHNYRLLCPEGLFFNKVEICEQCVGRFREWNCIKNRCLGSLFNSVYFGLRSYGIRKWGCFNKIASFLVLSDFQKTKLQPTGFDLNKMHVLPNAIFIPEAEEKSEPALERKYVGFVGRMIKEKGFFDFIRLARLMPDYSFRVAGEKTKTVLSMNIPPNVSFAGFLSKQELQTFYRQCRVIIFPSHVYEPFGLVMVEAMIQRTPVIAYDLAAISEIVEHEKTGFLLSLNEGADGMVEKVECLFKNDSEYTKMQEASYQKIREKYSAEVYYETLMQVVKIHNNPPVILEKKSN